MGSTRPSSAPPEPDLAEVPVLIDAERIAQRVRQLAGQISVDYAGRRPLVIGVLHGAFVFMSDLVRRLTVPARCGFIMISSYGEKTETTGRVNLHLDLTQRAEDEHVLIVDDIVDTGISTAWLLEHVRARRPASVKLCALLDKPARRRVPVTIDYVGFEIPDRFVVGYGIDWAGRYRELPYIGYVATPCGGGEADA